MKTHGITRLGAIALLLSAQITGALAVTFTQDTFIDFSNLAYEGADIVVTNCTLTVDGPHIFHSLQVQNAGVLTHSANTNGPQQFTFFVANEPHTVSATNPPVLFNQNVDVNTITVLNSSKTTVYTEGVDYFVTFPNQYAQLNLTTNSTIPEGATVLVSYDWMENVAGFTLYINNGATVQAGGTINVSGKGYAGGLGFGSGSSNTTNPASLGAGGAAGSGSGGSGGGLATILVGGNFHIDGSILAGGTKGTNMHSGGGSGGSLLLSAETFSGTGTISANGGGGDTPDGAGGNGGRIALYFATNNFAGALTAFGGSGSTNGAAGTIYLQADADPAGQLFIVNAGKRGASTTFAGPIRDLTVGGGAIAQTATLQITNLFVGSNSWVVLPTGSATLTLVVNGNATIESNGIINADFKSFSRTGTGTQSCGAGPGASYGGVGGTSVCGSHGGPVYGAISQPSTGSGTDLAPGGGAINLTVGGTLSLSGKISANGAAGSLVSSGNGSGGGVWLNVGTLSGTGVISANGGSASNLVSGGGGGGRIAIYFNTNSFAGTIMARGGSGTNYGGPGSIYLKNNSNSIPQIIFDNGGIVGSTYLTTSLENSDLSIVGGAAVTNFVGAPFLNSLFIGSNSLYTGVSPNSGALTAVITNATIQAGGALMADGMSTIAFPIGGQPGGLDIAGAGGGGGGGAGYGGGIGVLVNGVFTGGGGLANSQYSSPTAPGGMGGSGAGTGGLGGGVMNLTVPGVLHLDGRISANGVSGVGSNSGGGGGGSIHLTTPTIIGTGSITANGGNGTGRGGGGGGGAIALYVDTNSLSGLITAYGGGFGTNSGGAGTVYLHGYRREPVPQLIVDNGGTRGAKTAIRLVGGVLDMTVTAGAVVSNSIVDISQIRNLLIGSNSAMVPSQSQLLTISSILTVSSNLTILAGGSFNADGINTLQSTGIGASLNQTGGGGGAAGMGGASAAGAAGGVALTDSLTSPDTSGGRGGGGLGQSVSGGNGGGLARVSVGGTLRVDGILSADGAASPVVDGGGGGGGSVSISTKILAGNGVISANGGAGSLAGGGGGGGHIGISFTSSNLFTGSIVARGGSGANYGGAGLVSLSRDQQPIQVTLDNGGVVGAVTPLFSAIQSPSLTVTGGAILTNNISIFTIQNLLVGSNSTWFVNANSGSGITVLTNATVQAGGLLTLGATLGNGLAMGQTLSNRGGGGGGHGGYGGASISNALGGPVTTDSMTSPTGLGSVGGGGNLAFVGGPAGGVLQLTVNGTMQLDGRLSADGGTAISNLNSGGGSGGSLWLKVGKLAGSGILSANGGAANNLGGGGGGGRVAVWYNTNVFIGSITARGGPGANAGGAGTVYLQASMLNAQAPGRLIFDNGGARGANSAIVSTVSINPVDLIITNGTTVALGIPSSPSSTWNNLIITSNSVLNAASNFNTIHLTIQNTLDIQPGGALTVDRQGSPANSGNGRGILAIGSGGGGGHGGFGSSGVSSNAAGGVTYDTVNTPSLPGSGGGSEIPTSGSAGGGVIQLTVKGTLNVNGVLSADGGDATMAAAGGGSGGSISVTAGSVSGSGRISADGGDGDIFTSGGGGGGRIGITGNDQPGSILFTGTISARGGAGVNLAGGAGTIYLKTNSQAPALVVVDNGGQAGTNTPLGLLNSQPGSSALALHNGAVGDPGLNLGLRSLVVDSGASLLGHSAPYVNLQISGDALVDTNSAITSDSIGHAPTFGQGAGAVDSYGDGGGGGYGGVGGMSLTGAQGGATFGSSNQPLDIGGAGGVAASVGNYSLGGGALRMSVGGTLTVNGILSANGSDGIFDGSGGAAGGSIWITASKFSGNGWLTVNGGMGEGFEGGGGGGGRIAIFAPTNSFAGNLYAFGGDGANPGQDGTIFVPTSLLISGSVTDSNGIPVAGLTLQPSGMASVSSDTNGAYSITVPPLWTGTVTPNGTGFIVPSRRIYGALMSNLTSENYVITTPAAFNLSSSQPGGTNAVAFNWYGLSGAMYQLQSSSNLLDWVSYGPAYVGGNAPLSVVVPPTNAPQLYFRLQVTY